MKTLNIQIKQDNKFATKYMVTQALHIVGEMLVETWVSIGGKW